MRAEGAIQSLPPNLPQVVVEFEGAFRQEALTQVTVQFSIKACNKVALTQQTPRFGLISYWQKIA